MDQIEALTGGVGNIFSDISYDKDYDIINSYNFVLRVEAIFNVPLRAVRGINKQNEYEYIQEGGLNDYVHMVRKPASQPFSFQVERYVSQDITEDFVDPLANGTELTLPLILYIYRGAKKDGKLPVRYYVFTNARVMGTQVGDLDAEKSGLHTITNTIAYSSLFTFTLPWGTTDTDNVYLFKDENDAPNNKPVNARTMADLGINRVEPGTKPKDMSDDQFYSDSGEKNPRSVRTPQEMAALSHVHMQTLRSDAEDYYETYHNYDKEEMGNKAKKYEYDGDPSGQAVSPDSKNNLDKDTLAEKAKKYEYDGDPSGQAVSPDSKNNLDIDTLAKKAKQYEYGKDPSGQVVTPEGQLSKAEMEGNAVGYTPEEPDGELHKDEMEANVIKFEYDKDASGQAITSAPKGDGKPIKYEYNKDASGQVIVSDPNMKGNPIGYKYGEKPSGQVKAPSKQDKKNALERKASQYEYSNPADKTVKVPKGQKSKSQMERKANKYPPKRSAKQVSDFLNKR